MDWPEIGSPTRLERKSNAFGPALPTASSLPLPASPFLLSFVPVRPYSSVPSPPDYDPPSPCPLRCCRVVCPCSFVVRDLVRPSLVVRLVAPPVPPSRDRPLMLSALFIAMPTLISTCLEGQTMSSLGLRPTLLVSRAGLTWRGRERKGDVRACLSPEVGLV